MQIAWRFQDRLRARANGSAWVVRGQINAKAPHNSVRVVVVETVKSKAVVETRRDFFENLSEHVWVDVRSRQCHLFTRRDELIERWSGCVGRHRPSISGRRRRCK